MGLLSDRDPLLLYHVPFIVAIQTNRRNMCSGRQTNFEKGKMLILPLRKQRETERERGRCSSDRSRRLCCVGGIHNVFVFLRGYKW